MNLNIESGKVGTYQGRDVFVIEEKKFRPEKSNRNFIYALGHQGTSDNLILIYWDKFERKWMMMGTIDEGATKIDECEPIDYFKEVESKNEVFIEGKKTKEEFKKEKKEVKKEYRREIKKEYKYKELDIDKYLEETCSRDFFKEVMRNWEVE